MALSEIEYHAIGQRLPSGIGHEGSFVPWHSRSAKRFGSFGDLGRTRVRARYPFVVLGCAALRSTLATTGQTFARAFLVRAAVLFVEGAIEGLKSPWSRAFLMP